MTTAQLVQVEALLTCGLPHSAATLGSLIVSSSPTHPLFLSRAHGAHASALCALASSPLPPACPFTPAPRVAFPSAYTATLAAARSALQGLTPESAGASHPSLLAAAALAAASSGDPEGALEYLAAIPDDELPLASRLLAGVLARSLGRDQDAVDAFSAALAANAYALEAIDALAELGLHPNTIHGILGSAVQASPSPKKRSPQRRKTRSKSAAAKTHKARSRKGGSDSLEWSDDDDLHSTGKADDDDDDASAASSSSSDEEDESWLGLYVEASCAFWQHQFKAAASLYASLLASFPNNTRLERRLATSMIYAGDVWAGHALFKSSFASDPSFPEGLDVYALSLFETQGDDELSSLASQILGLASSCLPDTEKSSSLAALGTKPALDGLILPQHLGVVALALARAGKETQATRLLGRALGQDPRYAHTHIIKGRIALAASKYSARAAFQAAARARGSASVLARVSSAAAAKQVSQEYPRRRMPYPGILKGIVESNMAIFEYRAALAAATRGVELAPSSPRALTLLGRVLGMRTDSAAKAITLLESALTLDSASRETILALVSLYVADGKYDDAVVLLRERMQNETGSAWEFHIVLAEVFTKAGTYNEALVHYHLALSLNPTNERAISALADLEALISSEQEAANEP